MKRKSPAVGRTCLPALASLTLCAACSNDAAQPDDSSADRLLISNVVIVDGTGVASFPGAVRIAGDRIAAVGDLEALAGETVIDGGGLTLAPGFIDTHSHGDDDLLQQPDALLAVSQGVTTIVVGQDGGSVLPLADFYAKVEAGPPTVNVASYAGHNTIRSKVMGEDFRRAATAAAVEAMAELLRQELASGALGLSTGLEYEPGIHSEPSEVLAMAQVAAAAGGRYISHVRSEDRWFEQALDEIIEIGRATGMPVQVSHIKLAMKRLWGEAPRILAKLDAARAEGIDITADIYPYEYWQSHLMVLLPERDYTDRAAIEEALDQIAPPDGLWITGYEPDPSLVGNTLTEIAAARGVDPATAFRQLAESVDPDGEAKGADTVSIIGTSMIEDDIRRLLRWPHTNICTDGAFEDRHPRARGAFTRVLARYVREENLLSLEEAVHRMTGLAAEHMGFDDRGVIRPGAAADLVLFDPQTVTDRATPEAPGELSAGIHTVWVAGEAVFETGRATAARPGKVIRRGAR
ncbi:MAG: N-acyl-D-amino-acid deacylase family protein [Woeseiaceae bacterium]